MDKNIEIPALIEFKGPVLNVKYQIIPIIEPENIDWTNNTKRMHIIIFKKLDRSKIILKIIFKIKIKKIIIKG